MQQEIVSVYKIFNSWSENRVLNISSLCYFVRFFKPGLVFKLANIIQRIYLLSKGTVSGAEIVLPSLSCKFTTWFTTFIKMTHAQFLILVSATQAGKLIPILNGKALSVICIKWHGDIVIMTRKHTFCSRFIPLSTPPPPPTRANNDSQPPEPHKG